MEATKSVPVVFFRESDQEFEYDGVTVPWFKSNYGGWFMRAQDIATLCGVPLKKARRIYEEVIPPELQTIYCTLETATTFLRALKEESNGKSFKVWQELREDYTDEYVEDKFDVPMVPMRNGKIIVPGFNMTMLHKLGGVNVVSAQGTLRMKVGKEDQLFAPVLGLLTNDSQVQFLIQGILEAEDFTPKSFRALVNKARKAKLVIADMPAIPSVKGTALRRDNAALEGEVARLRGLLEAANIDPDQTGEIKEATLHTMTGKQDEQLRKATAVIKALINEHYPLLYVQAKILREVSLEMAKVYKTWDHKKFANMFNNERILNLLADIQTRCNSLEPDVKVHEIEQVVRQNLGRYHKTIYDMAALTREHYGNEMEKLPRAA